MVMFDSLNRHMLPPYGCDWVHAPNFTRLAARALTPMDLSLAQWPAAAAAASSLPLPDSPLMNTGA